MPATRPSAAQTAALPPLEQTSTAGTHAGDGDTIEAEQGQGKKYVDQRDGAGRRVVGFLDRLIVDQQRQGDDAFGADEQDDAEFVDGEQQAKAAARQQGW